MLYVQGSAPALFMLAYTVWARRRAQLLLGSARKQKFGDLVPLALPGVVQGCMPEVIPRVHVRSVV